MENAKKGKKQVPLRLSDNLSAELAAWAEDEFRSVNGQTECTHPELGKWRKEGKREKPNPT
mgnify:CR=1 FL=1